MVIFRSKYKLNSIPESEFDKLNEETGNILVWIVLMQTCKEISMQIDELLTDQEETNILKTQYFEEARRSEEVV
jgi:hypothetical protein